MKEKMANWWNRPITWGDGIKFSVWGTLFSAIGFGAWLFGIAKLNEAVEKIKQRTKNDVDEIKRKANYYEVTKEDVVE